MGKTKVDGSDPYRTLDEADRLPLEEPVSRRPRWIRLAFVLGVIVAFGAGYKVGARHPAQPDECRDEILGTSTFNHECTYPGARIAPLGGTYSTLCVCPEKKP